MNRPRRILVVRTDRIGDVLLATPLIRSLRHDFPEAHLAALVRPYARDVLAGNPHLDEILVDDATGEHRGARGFLSQAARLRRHRFDTALLLMPTSRMGWMLFLAGIPVRIGVGRKFYEVVTGMKTVSRNGYVPLRHEADYCLDLGRAIGASGTDLSCEMFLADDERRDARGKLAAAGARPGDRLVGMHPGSGGSAPNWRPERWEELGRTLAARGAARIVLTGGEHEAERLAPLRHLGPDVLVDVGGALSLRELSAVVAELDVLVSASTGPMHMAAALRVPTVSLFCPLTSCSPDLWGPRGNRSEIVLPAPDYCSRRCPGDPHVCDFEGGIDVDRVADRVLSLLEE